MIVLDVEDELKHVQTFSKLASLKLQKSDETLITDIKNKLCPIGCIGDHAIFQGSFPVSDVSFPQSSGPFFHAKKLSKWRIKLVKKEDKLGIFLECLSLDRTESSCEVTTEFCLENQTDRKKDIIKSFKDQFCNNRRSLGYPSIIDWQLLKKEYTSNNMMKIQVKVW